MVQDLNPTRGMELANVTGEPTAVRWRILAILVGFSLCCYLLRMNISVAQAFMVPELGLSDIQIGEVFSAFMLGYALFQIPAGVWGDRKGPRFVLTIAAIGWGLTTLWTGLIPGQILKGATAAFVSLLILRFLLGMCEAAMYPVAARAVANWMPVPQHAFSNAVVIAGSTIGSALTPPLISNVMQALGWRATFYLTGLFPFGVALMWWWQARDRPEQHSGVSPAEIALIAVGRAEKATTGQLRSWWSLLRDRNLAFLSLSYFLTGYVMFVFVFWLYKYLIDVRKFSLVGGGWASSLPFVVATIGLPSFGYLSDRWAASRGALAGRRAVAVGCLVSCGLMLWAGASASGPWMAVAAISLSVGFLFSVEGPYWSTAIVLAGPNAGTACGVMNMAGNMGGVVSTAFMPLLVHWLGWFGGLLSASIFAIIAAALWLLIREPLAPIPSSEVPVAQSLVM